jgi:hypothetical protein
MSDDAAHVMSKEEYDRERRRLVEIYGEPDAKPAEIIAKRDQAIAQLHHHSGWSQGRIAAEERKSKAAKKGEIKYALRRR